MHALKSVHLLRRNLNTLVQLFSESPLNFRYGCLCLTLGFVLGVTGFLQDALVLTVSNVLNFRIWKFFTSVLVETNVFVFIWSVSSLYQFCTIISPMWGLLEVTKYVAIVQAITTLLIVLLAFILFVCFQALNLLYFVPICGFPVFIISVLVAVKQFLPDTVVLSTPYGRLKNGHMPLTVLSLFIVLWICGLLRGGVPFQVAFGLQVSWIYLRYFRHSLNVSPEMESGSVGITVIGDDSEHFTWASFFPRKTQHLANAIGNVTFRLLISLKVCKKLKHMDLNKLETTLQATLQSFESRDAERKRQKALRMLNERLSSVVTSGGSRSSPRNVPASQRIRNESIDSTTSNEIPTTPLTKSNDVEILTPYASPPLLPPPKLEDINAVTTGIPLLTEDLPKVSLDTKNG